MISVNINGKLVETTPVIFSDGAVSYTIKYDGDINDKNVVTYLVSNQLPASSVIDHLRQCKDAVEDLIGYPNHDQLILGYLPYARHDRRFAKGNNSGLEVFLEALDAMIFDEVTLYDPHSEVYQDYLFTKTIVHTQLDCFKNAQANYWKLKTKWDYVIAPDKGAKDKAKTIADYLGLPLVLCSKERDVTTGALSNPQVNGEVKGNCLIVDDLIDGGYTFLQLGSELKRQGATQVDLYVTHLIASKGLDILRPAIDKVTCFQIVGSYVTMQDLVKFNKGE